MTPNYTILIATLRILGYPDIAKIIKRTQPILQKIDTLQKENYKYLQGSTNKYYFKPNTPIHAQLDLIHWDTIEPAFKTPTEESFETIYYKLKKLHKEKTK